jgi:hypothetical protein
MSVIATAFEAEDDGESVGHVPGGGFSVESLVALLHAEYGVDPQVIRSRATEVLATFAGARIQAFVPILVEKRLREMCRDLVAGPGRGPAAAPEEPPGPSRGDRFRRPTSHVSQLWRWSRPG